MEPTIESIPVPDLYQPLGADAPADSADPAAVTEGSDPAATPAPTPAGYYSYLVLPSFLRVLAMHEAKSVNTHYTTHKKSKRPFFEQLSIGEKS